MAIGKLHVSELTPEQRKSGAERSRIKIRDLMANPFLTPDQKSFLEARLHAIDVWEKGGESAPPPQATKPVSKPVSHSVSVSETLKITEK